MTTMYDDPKVFDGQLKAFPHSERGSEVRTSMLFAIVSVQQLIYGLMFPRVNREAVPRIQLNFFKRPSNALVNVRLRMRRSRFCASG